MSNPYYENSDPGSRLVSGTTARATDVEAKFDGVAAGFDLAHVAIEEVEGKAEAERILAQAAATTATAAASAASASSATATSGAATATSAASTASAGASTATTAASTATSAASAALASQTKASQWADSATEVEPSRYSAKWWAEQAEAIVSSPVVSVAGKTGVVLLNKADVGLTNVDNTSDANKPVSTATQTALDAKESLWTETSTATSKTLADNEWVKVTAAGQTITLPLSAARGVRVRISVGNFTDTVISRNGATINGTADDATINEAYRTVTAVADGDGNWGVF